MQYYHDLVTHKSWEELQKLNKLIDFILIGDWATYLYTKGLKSKDIDVIIEFDQLSKIQKNYNLIKNERLKKYEARREEVQIDIYLPHYSNIGLAVEVVLDEVRQIEGYRVVKPNYLFALKLYVFAQRFHSPKGRKDFIDAVGLLGRDIVNLNSVNKIVKEYGIGKEANQFKYYMIDNFEAPELNLNKYKYSRLKKNFLSRVDF